MAPLAPLRGQVYDVPFRQGGRKPAVIVSNNRRNEKLPDVLVARLTTAPKPTVHSIVELDGRDQPLVGRVLCDDLDRVPKSLLTNLPRGALTAGTMRRVDEGLKVALALR